MQFKVYHGSFGLIILLLLAMIFFLLPAILVFAMIATVISVIAGIVSAIFGQKKKRQTISKSTAGPTIDIPAEIE